MALFPLVFHNFRPAIQLPNHQLPPQSRELHSFSSRIRKPAQLKLAPAPPAF